MAPKNAKGKGKDAGGKGKDAGGKGKDDKGGKPAVKGAQSINVRHILVRDSLFR
jgi:hypothetical protein